MINELHQLSLAMSKANIDADNWHRKYTPIAKIKTNTPCVRIVFADNKISLLDSVDEKLGRRLRRYGSNQGSFPAMNLAPLYRITDKKQQLKLSEILKSNASQMDVSELESWCDCNNWGSKFSNKYKNSMVKIPEEIREMLQEKAAFNPVIQLMEEVKAFSDPQLLHEELKEIVFEMLKEQNNISLALKILFYVDKGDEKTKNDYGKISVILDSDKLEDEGLSTATDKFTKGLNQALQIAENEKNNKLGVNEIDAFGVEFATIEKPMPVVKLAGGFNVSLRTMFKGQPCQRRYGRIENATYPISPELRSNLQAALAWISSEKMRNKTWVNIDKDEILFVFPLQLATEIHSFTDLFQKKDAKNREIYFESEAKDFSEYLIETKKVDPDNYPDKIQILILRKLDRARTKAIYTRCVSPDEIVGNSGEWQAAAKNLPKLPMVYPMTPFPMKIAEIMNRTWKLDGKQMTEKFKVISNYHGMELLFGVPKKVLENDLHSLMARGTNLILYAGRIINSVTITKNNIPKNFMMKLRENLAVTGMLLYKLKCRKEDYMNEYPYLLGQLLKTSDYLHELYCHEVRGGQMPSQLVGNSMYVAAIERPTETLAQLGRRMMPYITWAKANREACIKGKRENSKGEEVEYNGCSAGYLLYSCEQIAGQLKSVMEPKNSFNDYEKAQIFIGYLATLSQKNKSENMVGGMGNGK